MMENNPYSPTVQASQFELDSGTSRYTLKFTRVLSRSVIGLTVMVGASSLVIGIANIVGSMLVPGFATGEVELEGLALAIVGVMGLAALVLLPTLLACIITYCVWMYRSAADVVR